MPGVDRPLVGRLCTGQIRQPLQQAAEGERCEWGLVGVPGVDRLLVLPGAEGADERVFDGADVVVRESPAAWAGGGALVGGVPLAVGMAPVSRR